MSDVHVSEDAGPQPDVSRSEGAGEAGRWLPLIALAALVFYFGIRQPAFLGTQNLTVLGAQAGPLLLISLGASFVILMGSIDLSVGGLAGLTAALGAIAMRDHDLGPVAVIVMALAVGVLAGLFNALLSTYLRLPSFIATLASGSIFTGIALNLLQGRAVRVENDDFGLLANGRLVPGVPNALLLAMVAWAVLVFAHARTRFGRYVVAIGAGERVVTLSGIRVRAYKTGVFILSSGFAALAGVFLLSRLGSATPTIGDGYLLDVVAAIVVGGTALTGGAGGVQRTLLGVALITILSNGLNISGVSSFTQEIVKGVVIILAVLTTVDREKLQNIIK
ncbi:MAG: ABC transporter permease [Mycobacterium sp.]